MPDSSDLVEHSELEARGPISFFVIAETVEGGVLIIGFCNAFVIQLSLNRHQNPSFYYFQHEVFEGGCAWLISFFPSISVLLQGARDVDRW